MSTEKPVVVSLDPRFARLVAPDAALKPLATGLKFTEGPAWVFGRDGADGFLVFSDIPANTLYRIDAGGKLSVFRKPSDNANGNMLARDGRLLTCEHGSRSVTVTDPAKPADKRVLIDRHDGKRFNSPNDLVERSDGTIWFTDPPYGLPKGATKELDGHFVIRFDPKRGKTTIVAGDFDMPNGLCFSPDEKRLYIADSGKPRHIRVFDVQPDGTLLGGAVFCTIDVGVPDGIRCDELGNVWSSSGDGVQVFDPSGKRIGRILVPESAANLCFGGKEHRTLFITARSGVYAIDLAVRGAR